ncbi:MAG: hypothetical protein ACOX6V_02815 [Patescibacteria group bacterium]
MKQGIVILKIFTTVSYNETMSLIDQLISIYSQFIGIFPSQIQWLISLAIFVAIVIAVVDLVKKNFIWLLLLIILIPASIPLLRSIFSGLVTFLQYLLQ